MCVLQGMEGIHNMKNKPHIQYCSSPLPPLISPTRKNRTNPDVPNSPTILVHAMRGDSIQSQPGMPNYNEVLKEVSTILEKMGTNAPLAAFERIKSLMSQNQAIFNQICDIIERSIMNV